MTQSQEVVDQAWEAFRTWCAANEEIVEDLSICDRIDLYYAVWLTTQRYD